MATDIDAMVRIGAAALGGLAVGIEREWSGHASGPNARFAGLRTFTLLGGLAGLAGWLWGNADQMPSVVLLAGGIALVLVAYATSSRRSIEATTEVAALVALGAAFLAGSGHDPG
jgi:peptidoglycan/LPS O-acetylase OafA/YrhL